MQRQQRDYKRWKQSNAPYLLAIALAFIVFMIGAPEVNEGDYMDPTIKDGQVMIVSKTSFNPNRKPPEQGQLIIMEKFYAQDVSEDNIIGRVAARPGETIEIKNGKVLVNGKEFVAEGGIKGAPEDMKKIKLKKDEVFLLCDNRDELIDSRNPDLGPVDMREIKGKVLATVWPLSDFARVK